MVAKLHASGHLGEPEKYVHGYVYAIQGAQDKVLVVVPSEHTIEFLLETLDGIVFAKRTRIYAYLNPCIRDRYPDLHANAFIVRKRDKNLVLPHLAEHPVMH